MAKNAVLIAISRSSNQLLTFLMLPFYTSWLTKGEYGLYDLIITYSSLISPLIMLNMETAVFRFLVDSRDDKEAQSKIITNAFELAIAASILALIAFVLIDTLAGIDSAYAMTIYFFSVSFGSLMLNIARGLGRMKSFAIAGILQGIIGAAASIIMIRFLGLGVQGLLIGLSLGALLPAIVLFITTDSYRKVHLLSRDSTIKKELLQYSLPLIPDSVSWWVFNVSDRTILFLMVSAAANGIYAIANRFSGIMASVLGVFYASWTETASLNINKQGRDELFSFVATASINLFGSLAFLGISATAVVFPILVDNAFNDALVYIPLLMFANFVNTITVFYSAIYLAKKLTKQIMYASMITAAVNVILMLSLVLSLQIWAAVISTLLANVGLAVYRHYDMRKYVNIVYKRFVITRVVLIYILISIGYYAACITQHYWINVLCLAVSLVAAYLLNRDIIKKMTMNGFAAIFRNKSH